MKYQSKYFLNGRFHSTDPQENPLGVFLGACIVFAVGYLIYLIGFVST